jgi:hypothetical protein
MARNVLFLITALALGTADQGRGQPPLPVVEEVEPESFRAHRGRLLETLEALKAPLPADTARALRDVLGKEATRRPDDTAARVQKLLDPLCLVGVTINPESRVKAARGPGPAGLVQDREAVVLIKVHNEAGVTHTLKLTSPQVRSPGQADGKGWLEAAVHTTGRPGTGLSGQKLEYVIVRLTAREAGKREATPKFDVGQGTQDLGFRAEVPVLFTVRPAER